MVEILLIVIVLLGLTVLGSNRVAGSNRLVAAQGVALAIALFVSRLPDVTLNLVVVAGVTIALKGLAIPWLLNRSISAAKVKREVDPFLGQTGSLFLGAAAVGLAFILSPALPLPHEAGSALIVPASLATLFTGLLLLVSRKQAVSQVLGYLVMENGILAFSLGLGTELPILVEMGILLDIFVAVFVMGIAIYQISREFDNIDAANLRQLSEMAPEQRRLLRRLKNGLAMKEMTEGR